MTDLRLGDAVTLRQGDCLDWLPRLPANSIDAVICDPPYPCIDRPYGRMTEADWHAMMRAVVGECRRVLKPTGSAVFVLQPNSERVGRMRPWLWEFMAWTCREWNMVQDAWWWNVAAMPEAHSIQGRLLRPSLKACVWLGPPGCYRDQDSVLWEESQSNTKDRLKNRCANYTAPGGHHRNKGTISIAAVRRGGVTPYNVLPITNTARTDSAGSHGHPAGTPAALCNWWVRYISPPAGVVCDPFLGTGTVGIEALKLGRSIVGIERDPGYFATATARIAAAGSSTPLSAGPAWRAT